MSETWLESGGTLEDTLLLDEQFDKTRLPLGALVMTTVSVIWRNICYELRRCAVARLVEHMSKRQTGEKRRLLIQYDLTLCDSFTGEVGNASVLEILLSCSWLAL